MAKILGLGGVFYRCPDVEAYRAWWAEHMDVNVAEWGSLEWAADGQGHTMMSPFKDDTDYLAPSKQPFMINLRVDDARAMLGKALAGGMIAAGEIETHDGIGTFAWFIDPAGIKIELWQAPPK